MSRPLSPPGPPSATILTSGDDDPPPAPAGLAASGAAAAPGARAVRAQQRLALLALGAAALLFSVMALLVKLACVRLPGAEVACLRFVIGLVVVAGAVAAGRRLRPHNLRALFWRGAFGGCAVLLYFLAIAHLPVGVATVLNYSSPIFTVLFSAIFLREPCGLRAALALALAFLGVVLITRGETATTPGGAASGTWIYLMLGVLSAVLSGAAVTTIRAMRQHEGSWEIFLAFCLIGAVVTAPPAAAGFVLPSAAEWGLLVGIGLSSVVAQILMTHALRDVRAGTGVLLLQLTPVSTFALGLFGLGERPSGLGLLGAVLTLLGITWGLVLGRGD